MTDELQTHHVAEDDLRFLVLSWVPGPAKDVLRPA